jgi:hypothetical protein
MQSGDTSTNVTASLAPDYNVYAADQMIFRLVIVQTAASGCCDFIAQCIMVRINNCTSNHPFSSPTKYLKIYRCWIVWDQNIRIVIIPSFLAIAYIGQPLNLSSSDKPIYSCHL